MRVGENEGLAHPAVVNFDNVHVVAKKLLGKREVKRAFGYALDWPELKVL